MCFPVGKGDFKPILDSRTDFQRVLFKGITPRHKAGQPSNGQKFMSVHHVTFES